MVKLGISQNGWWLMIKHYFKNGGQISKSTFQNKGGNDWTFRVVVKCWSVHPWSLRISHSPWTAINLSCNRHFCRWYGKLYGCCCSYTSWRVPPWLVRFLLFSWIRMQEMGLEWTWRHATMLHSLRISQALDRKAGKNSAFSGENFDFGKHPNLMFFF